MSNVQKWVEKCEFTEPVYHVWICDLNVFNCRNYRTAYNLYRERRYMGVSE